MMVLHAIGGAVGYELARAVVRNNPKVKMGVLFVEAQLDRFYQWTEKMCVKTHAKVKRTFGKRTVGELVVFNINEMEKLAEMWKAGMEE